MHILHRAVLAAALTVALAWPGTAPAATRTAASQTPAGLSYVVRYTGDVAPDTLELLKQVSKAETLIKSPPDSILLLERRAEEDKAAFAKVFQSDGYFAAAIAASVDQAATPAVLTYAITPGPRFTLRRVTLSPKDAALPTPEAIGLTVPSPFSAKAVVDAEAQITTLLRRQGHPYAKVADRKVTADFDGHDVTVAWEVDAGPKAAFGPPRFSGLTSVKEGYLAGLTPWTEGAPYDADLVEKYRKKLVSLDLFTLVQVEPAPEPGPDGRVAMVVTVAERKHRTVKGGVDYRTDEGPGANLGWEHRNLFGGGEKLSLSAGASAIEQVGQASFEKPDFITPKELFKASAKVANENKKAYEGQNVQATGSVRRQFSDAFSAAAGLGYRASRIIKDQSRPWEDDKRYGFVFVPVEAGYDTRNDVLDPQKGLLASASAAPYWGTLAGGPNFVRPEFSLANYLKIMDKPGVVLATRVSGGANVGADRDDVSPDLRYYAGGAGSIRGYPYQTVGPLRGKTPVGGGSVFTFSSELRLRITELIGIVPFLDGGTAYENPLPPYNQPLLLGAGLGVRVYTPVGPVRLDVATPVTPRKDIDDIAQFYFSIGQSF
ncbi:autotransporter assembly complex family protein [Solidesulfovibrio sp.]|uniref:autotransporter assembly complex protein TamA n=1 Tax=Solidesulfovibrio sp. TaxID=2910990 RepID=UPI00262DC7A0|nr:autotransporter assembly complex family protein [Solidesulfovibrio sp.]